MNLDGVAFDQAVALRTAVASRGRRPMLKGSKAPVTIVVVFPPIGQPGMVRIMVKNVGGVAERSFVWELPATK